MAADLPPFVAIDFETANTSRDSACSVAVVRVEKGKIVASEERLIRPPQNWFEFTYIHGITWKNVAKEPDFKEVWAGLGHLLRDASFLAAHNASFDAGVLKACCERHGIKPPAQEFVCTVKIARTAWNIFPTKLDCVCRELNIQLKHHNALSDAEACAHIILKAAKKGHPITAPIKRVKQV
jgi:DNA polymerase-3 subunit epsilon